MPLDEYDDDHDHFYYRVINVYKNDNINNIINNFCKSIKDENNENLIKDLNKNINKLKNSLEILEDRHICSISARIAYYPISLDITEIGYILKWIMLTVWRRNRI